MDHMFEFLFGGLCLLIPLGVTLVAFAFWIWMLIDCLTKEPGEDRDKLIWVLVLIFTNWIGALIYFFVRRPDRIKRYGE